MSDTRLNLSIFNTKLLTFPCALQPLPSRPAPSAFFPVSGNDRGSSWHSDPESHSWLRCFSHTSHRICQWIMSIPPSKQNPTPSPSHPSHSSHPGPSHSYMMVEPRLPTPSPPTQPVCFCLFPMAAKTFLWKHVRLYHYHSSALNLPLAAQHIIPVLEVSIFAMISKAFLTSLFLSLYCPPYPLCSSYTLLSLLFLRHIRCAPRLWPLHLLCPLWNALPRFLHV